MYPIPDVSDVSCGEFISWKHLPAHLPRDLRRVPCAAGVCPKPFLKALLAVLDHRVCDLLICSKLFFFFF